MIKSNYIIDILNLMVDGEEDETKLKQQILCLTENEFEHTGVGLFINFTYNEKINNYKLKNDLILIGVEINSPQLLVAASATLFMQKGIISSLSILANGSNYPTTEPIKYILKQLWTGKQIIKE